MSDKKPEIIPVSMVYQSNNKLQNCKVLINRSDNNLVTNLDIAPSSNIMQGNKNTPRLQSVVKVTNPSTQPIVRTITGAKFATIGRVVPSGSSHQPTLIMQPAKSILNQQSVQHNQQLIQQNQIPQQNLQPKLQQQALQPNSQTQTILIPQSIKSPNSFIYQALPLSTTQRINKSFIKRSSSNTSFDADNNTSPSSNMIFTKSCNSISNVSNSINNTKIYRVVGGPPPHIKTTSIIKPPSSSVTTKSNSMAIFNNPQQLNKTSHHPAITQRLILPATNQYQMSFAPSKQASPLIPPPVASSITILGSTTTTSANDHSIIKNESEDLILNDKSSMQLNNLSFSLIPTSAARASSSSDSKNSSSNNNLILNNKNNNSNIVINNNNNNFINNNNSIVINDSNDEDLSCNMDFVQGYKTKISEQQGKAQKWLSSIESKLRQRKPCNCTKSQCLKLYCECFANGEFCKDCNCCNCANNLEHEEERARAVRNCIERNPHAFHPKIGKGGSNRHHNKGCNCKRSGCLKNYCECYEAKILCSHLCRCISCRNYENSSDRQKLMQLADVAEARVQQQTAADNKLSMHILGASSPVKPQVQAINGQRPPYTFVTLDVIEAISSCLIAEADDHQTCSEAMQERCVLEEFGRCLSQVIEMASKSKTSSP